MRPYRGDEDEALTAELGEALRAAAAVPDRFLAAGKAAFAWRNVDADLAALAHDSATEHVLAGTRSEPATLRALTFVASRLTIEIEVTAEALQGQVVPPQPGQIELQQRDKARETPPVEVDELGWFVFRPAPHGMWRMRLRTGDGNTVLTEWITL
jgi:hypothetical protein